MSDTRIGMWLLPIALFAAGLAQAVAVGVSLQSVPVDVEFDATTSAVLLDEGYIGIQGDGCECIYVPRWRELML